MNLKEIRTLMHQLGNEPVDTSKLLLELSRIKQAAVKNGLEEKAKVVWIHETILHIHASYTEAFRLMKAGNYYDGWCKLEDAEVNLGRLRRHFDYDESTFQLRRIENVIKKFQFLFPYKMFSSGEYIEKQMQCSICKQTVSIRNPCGHVVGEIYKGEMCCRIVTDFTFAGVALVDNPVNKYAVLFLTDQAGEKTDHYNYQLLDYLMPRLTSPFEKWGLEIQERLADHQIYHDVSPDDDCPCGSHIAYRDCCLLLPGVVTVHYEFILNNLEMI